MPAATGSGRGVARLGTARSGCDRRLCLGRERQDHGCRQTRDDHHPEHGALGERRPADEASEALPEHDHHRENGQLPELDPDIERDDPQRQSVLRQCDPLQAGREAEPVDEPEAEDDRTDETPVQRPVPDTERSDEDHAEGDRDIDEGHVHLPSGERRDEQRQAVTEDEEGDELGCHANGRGKEDAADDEEQVVPTERHVLEAEHDVLDERPVRVVVDAEPVRQRGGRQREEDTPE